MEAKWQVGPVKLANGEDALIDAINEGQEDWRYTGRVKAFGIWESAGWDDAGHRMFQPIDSPFNLGPPPKKTVRVKVWLMIWPSGVITAIYNENDAIINTKKHGFAILPIDREFTEGEGL